MHCPCHIARDHAEKFQRSTFTFDKRLSYRYSRAPMTKKRKTPPLSNTDLAILSVLWRETSATGRQIYDAMVLNKDIAPSIAYTTLKTYLDRLIQKGYADAKMDERRGMYFYRATVARDDVMNQHDVLEHVIESLHLTPSAMVRWFAGKKKLSAEEVAKLRRIIEESNSSI
jgi:predicted transcriptional regulator